MGGVDFVKSDGSNNRSKQNGYDIEYTNPEIEEDITKPKHGNLLGWAHRSNTTPVAPAKAKTVAQPTAASAAMPTTQVKRTAAYQPVAVATKTPTLTPTQAAAASKPQPVTARLTEHHLPPPPPPPVHAAAPVAPVMSAPIAPAVQPVPAPTPTPIAPKPVAPAASAFAMPTATETVTPVLAPTMPSPAPVRVMPMAPAAPIAPQPIPSDPSPMAAKRVVPAAPQFAAQPVAQPNAQPTQLTQPVQPMAPTAPAMPTRPTGPIAAAAPITAQRHTTSVGEIVAQNVSGMRGETTHPEAMEPDLFGVNLLPNASQQPMEQTPLYRLLRSGVLMVMTCALVYLAMVGYQAFFIWRTHNTLAELTDIDNQILTYRQLQSDINVTTNQLTAIQDLLNDHLYWSQWFTFLEQNTLPTVYYSSFSGSDNGTMNLQVIAPDFTTVSQQIAAFRALPEVTDVTVTTAARSDTSFSEATGDASSAAQSNVQFTMSLQVDPALLHFQPNGLYE